MIMTMMVVTVMDHRAELDGGMGLKNSQWNYSTDSKNILLFMRIYFICMLYNSIQTIWKNYFHANNEILSIKRTK